MRIVPFRGGTRRGAKVVKPKKAHVLGPLQDVRVVPVLEHNLLVIIVMIRWTGLAPWKFEFPCPGS